MSHTEQYNNSTIDSLISEAIKREKQLQRFYEKAVDEVGPDAMLTMSYLHKQHDVRIQRLEELAIEIEALRELTASIAD